jgi:hypothetical protein
MRRAKLFKIQHKSLVLFLVIGLAVLQQLPALAVQSVTLNWKPSTSPNVRGYKVYYSTTSHNYNNQITISGDATNATLWGLAGGTTYFFAARSFKNSQEQSDLSTELAYTLPLDATNQPPILTTFLANKAFLAGQNVTFNISAIGTGTLTYQWNFNGKNIIDATNSVLSLQNADATQAGTYCVTVSDDIGSTNSNPAVLITHVAAVSTQLAATLTPVTGLEPMNDGKSQYALDVSGIPGYTYVVETSTNLQDWVPAQTNMAPFTFVDTDVDQFSQRFYRAFHQ